MIGWLRRLFTGEPYCSHEYETFHAVNVYSSGYERPTAFEYHLRCKKCGWVCNRRI